MKVKILFSFLFVVLLCVFCAGCYDETYDKGYKDVTDLYTLTQNDDKTYSYTFADLKGNILFEKQDVFREPKVKQVSPYVYGLITQTGTGLSTNWAVYCDVENSKTSEIYYYVLDAKDNYLIRADFRNKEHFIIVQNIFNKEEYYKEYKLDNVSPVAADFVVDFKFDDIGNFIVTYVTGEDYTKTDFTISLLSSTEENIKFLPDEYDIIINNIINAHPWNDDLTMVPENPELSYMYRRNSELSEVGFALIDLDGNGQEELIISDPSKFVYDLYTISNGKAVHLFDSGERYCYILRENGLVENSWSGSAATSGHDFYKLNDGKLDFVERITLDAYHALDAGLIGEFSEANENNCFFISPTDKFEDYKSVSFDEAIEKIESYQNANKELEIEYTLLSDYK